MNQHETFTQLYQQYAGYIRKLCLGYTGDESLADDLLQETFIAVWNNMHKFRGEAQWSTWIYRIAVNTCLSHIRKKKEVSVDIESNAIANITEEISTIDQEVQLLYKCISQLPETDRLIISLVLEDQPYGEISVITGITESNLRVKIHRIKKQLTEIYNRYAKL